MAQERAEMPTSTEDELVADIGYNAVIKAMYDNSLPDFRTWRPESLRRFQEAFVEGELDPKWFEHFSDLVGKRYRWTASIEDPEDYASYRSHPDEPFAVIGLQHESGSKAAFILRPEGEIIEFVPAFNTAF